MTEDNPIDSGGANSAAAGLAAEIRRLRTCAGLSQKQLAVEVGYTRQYVSLAERVGGNLPSLELIRALDARLDAGGQLLALRAQARADRRALRDALPTSALEHLPGFASPFALAFPPVRQVEASLFGISAPAGRFFAGAAITATSYPAVDDGRIVVRVPTGFVDDPALRRPGRNLVVGSVDGPSGPRLFALDNRAASARLAKAVDGAPLLIPGAYELDDLTLGVLWAVANLDGALLDDDSALAAAKAHQREFDGLTRSVGGPDLAEDLSAVSRMWLGSDFCARHILRHTDALHDVPAFWTREQRGEESSTWLVFAHKYTYLAKTAGTFITTGAKPTRTSASRLRPSPTVRALSGSCCCSRSRSWSPSASRSRCAPHLSTAPSPGSPWTRAVAPLWPTGSATRASGRSTSPTSGLSCANSPTRAATPVPTP
ncbi:helix-turn-helix transcriptional regulator [Actinokineospora sp. 24-640]